MIYNTHEVSPVVNQDKIKVEKMRTCARMHMRGVRQRTDYKQPTTATFSITKNNEPQNDVYYFVSDYLLAVLSTSNPTLDFLNV